MKTIPALTTLALAASSVTALATSTAPDEAKLLTLSPIGLQIFQEGGESARQIRFGQPIRTARTAVAGVIGPQLSQAPAGDCALAVTRYRRGLQLWSKNGRFVGWDVTPSAGRKITTESGVGIGSKFATVRALFPDATTTRTPFGRDFTAGGLKGSLNSANEISWIHYGKVCDFR